MLIKAKQSVEKTKIQYVIGHLSRSFRKYTQQLDGRRRLQYEQDVSRCSERRSVSFNFKISYFSWYCVTSIREMTYEEGSLQYDVNNDNKKKKHITINIHAIKKLLRFFPVHFFLQFLAKYLVVRGPIPVQPCGRKVRS